MPVLLVVSIVFLLDDSSLFVLADVIQVGLDFLFDCVQFWLWYVGLTLCVFYHFLELNFKICLQCLKVKSPLIDLTILNNL